MTAVYITALVVGLGTLMLQLLGGHDGDAGGGHDAGHDAAGHDGGPLILLASVRFWAFALLAFGLVGTLLRLFQFAGVTATALIAGGAGLASGYVAASVVRRLQVEQASSIVTSRDIVGRVGKILVPPTPDVRGKVRVRVRGSFVDYVAKASEPLGENEAVIVEEFEDGEVVVSRAPK
jgi:membrane protein implicated in regulation of membrane protease activity